MSDTAPMTNAPELSVSDLAGQLKRTIETNFDRVRVRGELGRVTIAKSGHMYADLKDDKAVLNTIMWKGSVSRLPFRPEEGLEVVAEGKLSIYAGRSNYQLIADAMRPAGVGALMALLEDRKKKLAAEGLFLAEHKKPLPSMPKTIGVVTSPTGAVIRDILHRIRDRFPVRVIVWPALVQGDLAAQQIEAGIVGFNRMTGETRPDVLMVARGGGSIEDLWPFNEEAVVRAAFNSDIPLISAVGHETDTTLIDYVSDARAPTPTGAAEIAVPVRVELFETVNAASNRLRQGLIAGLRHQTSKLETLTARLPKPDALISARQQRFDYAEANLRRSLLSLIDQKRLTFSGASGRFQPGLLRRELVDRSRRLEDVSQRHGNSLLKSVDLYRKDLNSLTARLRQRKPDTLIQDLTSDLSDRDKRFRVALGRVLDEKAKHLKQNAKLLETLSYQATVERGFAVVRTEDGSIVRRTTDMPPGERFRLTLSDGDTFVSTTVRPPEPARAARSKSSPRSKKTDQGSLF